MDVAFSGFNLPYELELLLRIVLASIFGALIGFERRNREKSAGMRTHSIVALGACLMMIVSKYGFKDIPDYDASRVAAQIVSGIGFLGAGVIFVRNNSVSGLTTAAGLWTTAGIGMAVGAGSYFIGTSAGVMVVAIQELFHRITFLATESSRGTLKLTVLQSEDIPALLTEFENDKLKILGLKIGKGKSGNKVEVDLIYPPGYERKRLIIQLAADPRIAAVSG